MRRTISTIIALILALSYPRVSIEAYQIKNIDLAKVGNITTATIYADGAIDFTHRIISEGQVKVIVDFKGGKNALPQRDFFSIPSATIKSIRTSQFSLDPLITRVVFDIGKPITYTIKDGGDRLILNFPTPDDPEFPAWAAVIPSMEPQSEVKTDEVRKQSKPKKVIRKSGSDSKKIKEPKKKIVKKLPQPPQKKGTVMKARYKRPRVVYKNRGTRDSFAPLTVTGEGRYAFGEIPVPAVEELKLVGILKDDDANIALLENTEGDGFMLKAQDKIKSGWVSRVTDNMVYFQVSEFGWTRTVAMKLQSPTSE